MAQDPNDYEDTHQTSITGNSAEIELEEAIDYDYPAQFRVIIHNDHYTAMDFVVDVLMTFFHKSKEEAETLMLTVHTEGRAIAGLYSREIAESKIRDINNLAKEKEYPLRLSMEKD